MMMKSFFFKVSFISYVVLYTDSGKILKKILARTGFTQNEEYMYGKG